MLKMGQITSVNVALAIISITKPAWMWTSVPKILVETESVLILLAPTGLYSLVHYTVAVCSRDRIDLRFMIADDLFIFQSQ